MTTPASSVDLSQLPGVSTVLSWLDKVKNDFLALPDRLQADTAALQYLQQQGPNASDGATLTQIGATFDTAQATWGTAASKYQSIQANASDNGADASTLVNGVDLAGTIAYLLYQVDSAEQSMDVVANGMLTPQQLATYRATRSAITTPGVGTGTKVVLGVVGVAALAWVIGRRGRVH